MDKLRIVFLGTPEIACGFLRRLAAAGHAIAGVVSQPDRPVGRGLKMCFAPVCGLAGELKLDVFKPREKCGVDKLTGDQRHSNFYDA